MRTRAFRIWLAVLLGCSTACSNVPTASPQGQLVPSSAGKLAVHFLDVGQGDAVLIISPTGKTVLVDGGPPGATQKLLAQLRPWLHGPLDLMVLTHPHLDHLGGLRAVLRSFGARRYLDSKFEHPSRAYADLLEEVAARGLPYATADVDGSKPEELVVIGLGGGASLSLLWPRRPVEPFLQGTRSDPNANSVVAKLAYGKTAFLLAGDAEPDTEAALLKRDLELHSTVLKVGHHGGHYSSTAAWLRAIHPKAAVISVGAGNDFGHPSPDTLRRLADEGAKVYRTDQDGAVTAVSDGMEVTLFTEREPGAAQQFAGDVREGSVAMGQREPRPAEPAQAQTADASTERFAASRKSDVFHRASCPSVSRMSPRNVVHYLTREAAARGRSPAKDCHP